MTAGLWRRLVACGFAVVTTAATFAGWAGGARVGAADLHVIPAPQQISVGHGTFTLRDGMRLSVPRDARAQWIASFLRKHVQTATGVGLKVVEGARSAPIRLEIDPAIEGKDAYHLTVTSRDITLAAHDDRGLFWGVQTLRQLLPLQTGDEAAIPAVEIKDAPYFQWRGLMLDVSRHFYPVSFIKKQIALMSYYKFDVFHWHLTDDPGWRIQIKQYPRLTSVGAWRTTSSGKRYGGFYTQKQIREVVEYARQRNVMVVPEIEMPGHTDAAIAAYPELSCSGKPIQVPGIDGRTSEADCVAKPGTYAFLENVLDEVIKLFPSPYVHIGGDEVPPDAWSNCAACTKLANAQVSKETASTEEGGANSDEPVLHSYFVHEIQNYLAGKGKAMVGWSEIMEGGMDPKAIVEEWLGPMGTAKTLANGNRIIVAGPFYLNRPIKEITLEDTYRENPFEQPLYKKYSRQVLGGEAALWGEFATPLNGEARLYPRLLAVAEHFWNPAAVPDWPGFQQRVKAQEKWLASQDIAYGPTAQDIVDYHVSFQPRSRLRSTIRWRISATRGFADLRMRYTRDGSQPTASSPSFGDFLDLYEPGTITVAPFRGNRQYETALRFRFVQSLVLGDRVTFATPPTPPHNGDALRLTDGILGDPTAAYTPNNFPLFAQAWDGWEDADMDATVHLPEPVAIHAITVPFLGWSSMGILLPRQVTIEVSNDGKAWTTLRTVSLQPQPDPARDFVSDVVAEPSKPVTASYVRVLATRHGKPFHGAKTWIFTDQIIVR